MNESCEYVLFSRIMHILSVPQPRTKKNRRNEVNILSVSSTRRATRRPIFPSAEPTISSEQIDPCVCTKSNNNRFNIVYYLRVEGSNRPFFEPTVPTIASRCERDGLDRGAGRTRTHTHTTGLCCHTQKESE